MKYQIVFEFERKEQYPLKEIIELIDYTIPNPEKMLETAFEQKQNEKVKRYVYEVENILENHHFDYQIKITKVLPKYLKDGVDIINFRVIFQALIEKEIKQKTFINKWQNEEFQLCKDEIPGLKKLIEELKPAKIFIRKV
jgi:hypothetical protein